ncbi:C1 family peptidase [Streptomyces sp. NPDC059398]|uniref:C1 family peptidase n=1 Tax=Streptomyces sp. NPDC059398 TaxID=3346820 RepID=UPI00369D03D4
MKRFRSVVGLATVAALSCLTTATTATAATTAPPAAGQTTPRAHHHGLGLNLGELHGKHSLAQTVRHGAQPVFKRSGAVQSSADLSKYALSPGDQGQVGSCVAWATGYSAYGIVMNEQGISGAPMAPMFIYSQIAQGNDQGTTASVALPMEQKQGIDTKADYTQGDFDFTTQPNADERANAAHYKLSGFDTLPTSGSSVRSGIENAISQGEPVVIGFEVHQSFEDLNAQTASDYSYLPGDSSSDPVIGGHEVTIVGYSDQGVKIENSWGGKWGDSGFFTVPWDFFNTGDVNEIHAVGKLTSQG